ncbi:MAG: GNAT family N-acetyltransferase [Chloroflexi bacterium]|nr:GNAT family N-acetyltransferase [Chloroflexota bacterium]
MVLQSGEEVVLRVFRPSDLAQITELERKVYGSGAYSYYFFRQLHDLYPRLVWVAESGGQLVGHVCGAIDGTGSTGWILNLAVQAHSRGRGVGGRLVSSVIEEVRARGARVIRTTLHPDNSDAIRVFERAGFRAVRIEEDYYGDGIDRLILQLTIEESD